MILLTSILITLLAALIGDVIVLQCQISEQKKMIDMLMMIDYGRSFGPTEGE